MSLNQIANKINKLIIEYQKGNKKKAINDLQKIVNSNPEDNIARYNLAIMLSENGKQELSINHYKKIIENSPNNWKSKFNLYLIFIDKKEFKKALNLIDEVLKIQENFQPALRDKALVLVNLKQPDRALSYIIKSLKHNPNDYIALNTLGIIYLELKKYNEAEKIFIKAININKNYISSYNNLGRLYSLNNKNELALKLYKKALKMDNNHLDSLNNLANYFTNTGNYKKGLKYYFSALKIDKKNNEILFNIGCAYTYLKDNKNAEKYFLKSLKIDPTNNLLQKNISILYLNLHRFKEAWRYFDGRIGVDDFRSKNHYFHNIKKKLWKGDNIPKNAKILVIKEQGIGDEILYSSMYVDLFKLFPKAIVETETRLISLFKRSFKNKNFVPYGSNSKKIDKILKFDTVIYAGSLGKLFRNNIKDFHKKDFLIIDPKKDKKIKKIVNGISDNKKIGISWISKNEAYGGYKSLDLMLLNPILKNKKYDFINLQYGNTQNEIKKYFQATNNKIYNIKEVDLFNDFESIAALLKNLDLFITVSNSTAHLAGALGVPTWVIKPQEHAVFHYWNQPEDKTPWYNSIRLFTHNKNWNDTLKKIQKKLDLYFK